MTDLSFVPNPIVRIAKGDKEARFFFAWFDIWVGIYFDPKNRSWYFCPLPCCVFYFGKRLSYP